MALEEYDADELGYIHSKIHDVDGVPVLRIWSDGESSIDMEIPIPNLHYGREYGPGGTDSDNTFYFDGGRFYINTDDRGPDRCTITIEFFGEEEDIYIYNLYRREVQKLERQLEYESRKSAIQARRARRETKKQRGRNVAAFRQTMGNLRPRGPNPVPNALATESGPGALIAEFLSGKEGSIPARQARRQKRESVRGPNRGGRRTRKNLIHKK
jgi:hypothetical protein